MFQQDIENIVEGYVRLVIQVVVYGEFFVYKVSFWDVEDGQ
jgi:hypothetical protein